MAWRLKFVQIIRLATSILRLAEQIQCDTSCAVERCFSRTGAKPAQQLSLQLSSGYSGSWWQQHGLKHFLARWERSLPDHWHQRYAIRPVLLETFRDIATQVSGFIFVIFSRAESFAGCIDAQLWSRQVVAYRRKHLHLPVPRPHRVAYCASRTRGHASVRLMDDHTKYFP